MDEIWKEIEEFPNYSISNKGRVLNNNNNHILKPEMSGGYYRICLCKSGKKTKFFVHRLVAKAFLENPENLPFVNHKDENRTNNYVENLEWCSTKYNNNYGNHNSKIAKSLNIPIIQLDLNNNLIAEYESTKIAAEMLELNRRSINNCLMGRAKTSGGYIWKYKNN